MGPKDLCEDLDMRRLAGSFPALSKQRPQQTRKTLEPRCWVGELQGQLSCGPGAARWQCSAGNRAPAWSGGTCPGGGAGATPTTFPNWLTEGGPGKEPWEHTRVQLRQEIMLILGFDIINNDSSSHQLPGTVLAKLRSCCVYFLVS